MASSSEIKKHLNCAPGSIGPVGLNIPLIIDYSAAIIENFYCGANRDGYHLTNVHWGNIQPTPEILISEMQWPGILVQTEREN